MVECVTIVKRDFMTSIAISPIETKNAIQLSLLQVLGQGGFGKVFLADVQSGSAFQQRVAIKVLHPEYQQETQLLARQLDEARMLGLLNHRNIVKVFDVVSLSGQNAILMEYVDGVSLSAMLKHQSIPWGVTWQLVADCASALTAAFQGIDPQTGRCLRLIHRDIKPSNLLVSKSGTLKVLDFGIAKMDGEREAKTSTHQMGTARYMAPEQWLENTSSSSVDVYALGRTALEMLLGRLVPRTPLDPRLHREQLQIQLQSVSIDETPRVVFDTGLRLLMEMLSHDPNLRPTVEEVADRALALAEAEGVVSIGAFVRERIDAISVDKSGVESNTNNSEQQLVLGLHAVQEYDVGADEVSNTTLTMQKDNIELVPIIRTGEDMDSLGPQKNHRSEKYWSMFGLSLLVLGSVLLLFWGEVFSQREMVADAVSTQVSTNNDVVLNDSSIQENAQTVLSIQEVPNVIAVSQEVLEIENPSHSPSKKRPVLPNYEVVMSSVPLGAEVFVDNTRVGRTLVTIQQLTEGEHQIRMTLGDFDIERTIDVDSSGRFVWRVQENGESEWLSY